MADLYKNIADTRNFIHKAAALSFIPPRFVRIAWTLVESEAPQTSEVDEFIQYFKSTWLDGHLPVRTWNCFNHDGPCTNNHIESRHNHLKKMARKAHPNLFEFIEVIQKEQATAEVTIEQLSGAGRVRAKKSNVVRHEEAIKKLMEEFTGGIRTLESFLSSLSHCIVSFDY